MVISLVEVSSATRMSGLRAPSGRRLWPKDRAMASKAMLAVLVPKNKAGHCGHARLDDA
ncbi:hypothetical protein [Rhizobium sp. Leaf371]|uniref:hypothetical protein n=1 Tax=Rhizobium sp. Leaf371 TaxID=1736355 RepID=UPI0012E7D016|nr:hypothetical protein [Rhizobium sp. Leaf371]